ncbi:MAG: M16 family metallopeptidase [Acidobacteriota bacterium]
MENFPQVKFQEYRLDNRLQVILHRDDRVPLVHVSVHYRIGSSYERPGLSGFAHLFEHMMFQGSENIGKNEHGRHVDMAGGSWNASTNKDRTNYYETLPAHYLELGLWLEADRMRSLKVSEENFENQRQTVIEEKKQSYDNRPYGRAYLRFDELAYQNWAYAHPVIGSVEDLKQATLEDALGFHRTYYGPGNATLVLSGDFEEKEALEKIRLYFNSIEDRTAPAIPDLSEPQQQEAKTEVIRDPLASLPALSIGYHMPAIDSPEYYALSVLGLVLSEGESSRFFRRLVRDENWVTGLSAGPNEYKGPEIFALWAQLQNGVEPQRILDTVESLLAEVQEREIPEQEIEKARNQLAHRFIERLTTVSRVGEWLARYALYYDDPHMLNRQLERFLSVTAQDIMKAAQRILGPENRTLVLVEPANN